MLPDDLVNEFPGMEYEAKCAFVGPWRSSPRERMKIIRGMMRNAYADGKITFDFTGTWSNGIDYHSEEQYFFGDGQRYPSLIVIDYGGGWRLKMKKDETRLGGVLRRVESETIDSCVSDVFTAIERVCGKGGIAEGYDGQLSKEFAESVVVDKCGRTYLVVVSRSIAGDYVQHQLEVEYLGIRGGGVPDEAAVVAGVEKVRNAFIEQSKGTGWELEPTTETRYQGLLKSKEKLPR
jgi:hypothetical protein